MEYRVIVLQQILSANTELACADTASVSGQISFIAPKAGNAVIYSLLASQIICTHEHSKGITNCI